MQFSLMMGLYFSAVHNSRRDTGIVVKYEKENHSDKDEESSDEVLEDVNMEDRS